MVVERFLSEARNHALSKLKIRFWSKVHKTTGCWEWTGAKNQEGRGLFRIGRSGSSAPRIAWELSGRGPIPLNLFVCHTCDNPSCVNPEHLWLGTNLENVHDRQVKGRCSRWKAERTHCPSGHEFNARNTRFEKRDGARSCRVCRRDQERARLIRIKRMAHEFPIDAI